MPHHVLHPLNFPGCMLQENTNEDAQIQIFSFCIIIGSYKFGEIWREATSVPALKFNTHFKKSPLLQPCFFVWADITSRHLISIGRSMEESCVQTEAVSS